MIDEIKAIQYAALMDEEHRREHPENVDDCAYCEYLQDELSDEELQEL